MSEIEEEKIIPVGSQEFIHTHEWPANLLKHGPRIKIF